MGCATDIPEVRGLRPGAKRAVPPLLETGVCWFGHRSFWPSHEQLPRRGLGMPAGQPQVEFRPELLATMGSGHRGVCILLTFTPPPHEPRGSALPPQLWLGPQRRPHGPLFIHPESLTHSIHSLSQVLVQQIFPEHLLHVRLRGSGDKYHEGAISKEPRVRSSPYSSQPCCLILV